MNDTTKIYFVCNFLGFFMLLFVLYMVLNMQRKIIVHDQEINALKLQISASESVANV